MQDNPEFHVGPGFFGPTASDKTIGQDPTLRRFVQDALNQQEERREMARYKIEVAFSWDRTTREPAVALITIWESGRRFHGGGDEKMFWCSYQDCGKPITSDYMSIDIGACPSCRRPLFRSIEDRTLAVQQTRAAGLPYDDMEKRPCISEVKLAKLSVRSLSTLLADLWRDLHCDADLYVKFFRKKIRFEPGDPNAQEILAKARMARSYVVYSRKAIWKDTEVGATVQSLFEAFLTA